MNLDYRCRSLVGLLLRRQRPGRELNIRSPAFATDQSACYKSGCAKFTNQEAVFCVTPRKSYLNLLKFNVTSLLGVQYHSYRDIVPSLWGGVLPLTAACAPPPPPPPPFRFTQITVLEHHSMTRQYTMMEKKLLRLNIILLGRFLDSLRNCRQPTSVPHKSVAIFRLITTPLRMCRKREMQACRIRN